MNPKPRIESVDALRGLLACGIMVFHVFGWTNLLQNPPVKNFWNWLGIYGVEMFFIISGFSMAYVYLDKPLLTKTGLLDFYWKRFMRLWPLYFAAYLVATLFRLITNDPEAFNPLHGFLHLTLLFGFVDPSIKGIIGGWSIGVEVVCYAIFPILTYALKSKIQTGILIFIATYPLFATAIWGIASNAPLPDYWPNYTWSLNHLLLFIVGGLFAQQFLKTRPMQPSIWSKTVLALTLTAAVLSPLSSTDTATVTGLGRLVFVVLSLAMCWISIAQVETPKLLAKLLNPIGLWSYSIYLLHPFAFQALKLAGLSNLPNLHAGLTIASTILLAKFSYQYLEKPSVDWARKKSDQWFKPQTEPIKASSSK